MCQLTGLSPIDLQNNRFIVSYRWLSDLCKNYTDTYITHETIRPYLLFRSLRIQLDHYQPQKSQATSLELHKLLFFDHLDRLEIEFCTQGLGPVHPEDMNRRLFNEARAISAVIHQLKEKFGVALKVLMGLSFAIEEEKDITWLWETPGPELDSKVARQEADESEKAWYDVWMAWSKVVDERDGGCEDGLERFSQCKTVAFEEFRP